MITRGLGPERLIDAQRKVEKARPMRFVLSETPRRLFFTQRQEDIAATVDPLARVLEGL